MNFFRQLYKIARLEASMDKLAGEGAGAPVVALLKLSLWAQMKAAAVSETGGTAVGLAKIARRVSNDVVITSGVTKTASLDEQLNADMLAVSFASALAVDKTIEKQAYFHEITAKDAEALYIINAESAVDDLFELAKTAAPEWLSHPSVVLGGLGAATGAGLGAWGDNDNRARGAVMGGIGGAAVGGLGGLAVKNWQDGAAEMARRAASGTPAAPASMPTMPDDSPVDLRSEVLDAFHDATSKLPTVRRTSMQQGVGHEPDIHIYHDPSVIK